MFHNCKSEKEINSLFKRLAKHLHPDHGGENDLMILLTEAKEKAVKGLDSAGWTREFYSSTDMRRNRDTSSNNYTNAFSQAYEHWREERGRARTRAESYHSTVGRVHRGSPNSRIIDDILAAAKVNPRIKTNLAEKAKANMEKNGFIEAKEFNDLYMYYKHKKVDQYA